MVSKKFIKNWIFGKKVVFPSDNERRHRDHGSTGHIAGHLHRLWSGLERARCASARRRRRRRRNTNKEHGLWAGWAGVMPVWRVTSSFGIIRKSQLFRLHYTLRLYINLNKHLSLIFYFKHFKKIGSLKSCRRDEQTPAHTIRLTAEIPYAACN